MPNNPFPEVPVTVPHIIRQVGHRAYQRGLAYQRNREVVRYSYSEENHTLTGLVNGSTALPYEVSVRFFPSVSGSATFAASCTCPVRTDCKHAVALMLTALERASNVAQALTPQAEGPLKSGKKAATVANEQTSASKVSTWRKNLSSILSARQNLTGIDSMRVSGALDLSLSVSGSYARDRNMPPG